MNHDELYLEKLKIVERLQAVENTIIGHTTEVRAWREQTQKLLDAHSGEIWGRDDSKPGLKTNMDRLLQIEKERKWFIKVLTTGLVGLIIKDIWNVFKH